MIFKNSNCKRENKIFVCLTHAHVYFKLQVKNMFDTNNLVFFVSFSLLSNIILKSWL